jgi:hypothetical protein
LTLEFTSFTTPEKRWAAKWITLRAAAAKVLEPYRDDPFMLQIEVIEEWLIDGTPPDWRNIETPHGITAAARSLLAREAENPPAAPKWPENPPKGREFATEETAENSAPIKKRVSRKKEKP